MNISLHRIVCAVFGLLFLAGSANASNTISGVVYDTNGTTPVAQGYVQVIGGYNWTFFDQANINVDGTFQTVLLPDGAYRLRVDNPPSHLSPEYHGDTIDADEATVLFVADGAPIAGIVFVLNPGGTISGHVYGTNVTWAVGENVHAAPVGNQAAGFGSMVDENGFYSIHTRTGEYYVNAGGQMGYIRECWPDVQGSAEGGTIVVVAQGVATNIDFQLELGGSISGRVYFADGSTPVTQGMVSASIPNSGNGAGAEIQPDGSYWINGLLPGDYKVGVSSAHGLPLGAAPEYYDDKATWDAADLVSVTAGEIVTNVDFVLPQGGAISGYVRDATNAPIGNIDVRVNTGGTEWDLGENTDTNGYYYIAVPVGEHIVEVEGTDQYAGEYYSNVTRWAEASGVQVSASVVESNVNFNLAPAASISGFVYEDGTTNLITQGSIDVCLYSDDEYSWRGYADVQPDGSYLVTGLQAEEYRLFISNLPQGMLSQYYDRIQNWNERTKVILSEGEHNTNINFNIVKGGVICGYLYQTNGVTPISDAWVNAGFLEYGDVNQWYGDSSDTGGYFVITVPPGTYVVQAGGFDGYARQFYPGTIDFDAASNITVVSGVAVSNVNFELLPGATISGKVFGPDGVTGVYQGWIGAEAPDGGGWFGGTQVNLDGTYSLECLPPGQTLMYIEDVPFGLSPEYYSNKYSWGSADLLNLAVGEVRTNVNFTLKPGGAISGYIYAADGVTPIQEDVYAVQDDGTDLPFEAESDASGYYYMQTGTGSYIVVAGGDNGYATQIYTNKFHITNADKVIVLEGVATSNINFALGAPVVGGLWIDVTPDKAPWTFINPLGIKWGEILVGDALIEDGHTLETGVWQVVWQPLPGYSFPSNNPGLLSVVVGQTNGVTGVYTPLSIDSDEDGMYDWQEWLAGTDPSNGTSCLKMTIPTNSPAAGSSGYVICWSSVSGRYYVLERATNLIQGFSWSVSNIPGYSPMNTFTDTSAVGISPFFYRVKLQE